MVKPKRRRSRVADYTCFGVAAGALDVIHGEQIAPRHKMHRHNVMRLLWHRDTCHVSRYTGHDYVICIAIRIAILRSRYNTRIVGPSIAMHRYNPTISLYCELVMTLYSPNMYFKSGAQYHRKIDATSTASLEYYRRVRFVLE